jgi:hypothetical protein
VFKEEVGRINRCFIRQEERTMTTTSFCERMPELPRAGQQVRWRDPTQARDWGWEAVFGPGPFTVVGLVNHSGHGLATGLILRTAVGDREISEVWLALAEEPVHGTGGGRRW